MGDWSDAENQMLRALWTQGHSAAEIGRRMGRSKNSIVGRAHRLDLDERPSPIRRKPGSYLKPPPSVPRVVGPTLPPLVSYVPPTPMPRPVMTVPPPPPPAVFRRRPSISCCWPIGEPGTKAFRFCGDPSVPGRPYCGEHANLAYVRVRDRTEEEAVR